MQQIVGDLFVVVFLLGRHQPPDGVAPRQQQTGAIELFQQQVMLGGAAAFAAELMDFPFFELVGVHKKEVHFQPHALGPLFDLLAFEFQLVQGVVFQIGVVADPDIEVAFFRLGDGAHAAHDEQGLNFVSAQGAAFISETFGEFVDGFHAFFTGRVQRNPRRGAFGNKAREHGVVDVEENRQQLQEVPLLPPQGVLCAP